MLLFRAFGITALFTFTVFISPVLICLYVMCWIWATITSIIYGFKKCTLLTGNDVVAGMELHSINSIINVLLLTQDNLSKEAIKETFSKNVINATDGKNRQLFPKFTSCLSLRAGYLMWSEAVNFNIDEHIVSYHGQPPHNNDELKAVINDLGNQPLSPSRPCWQFIVIPLQFTPMTDGNYVLKTCFLLRAHHSIADGIAFSRILFETVGGNIGAIRQVHQQMYEKFNSKFRNAFMKKLEIFIQITQVIFFAPAVIWKYVFHNDRPLIHSSKLSGVKIYDWSSPIKLSIIKDIKNKTGTTVNDVITSCLAAAVRKVILQHGACPPFHHVLFMASLQSPQDPIEAKNELVFIHAPLPTGDMGCMQRLKTTKAIMDDMKKAADIKVISIFMKYVCGTVPYRAVKWIFKGAHQIVMLSNVPGPSNKLNWIGKFDSMVVLAQNAAINDFDVMVYSYADEVTVSVTTDTAMINHKDSIHLLLKEFIGEIQQLHAQFD